MSEAHDASCPCSECLDECLDERAVPKRVFALASAMRAIGAGRATLDGLSLDLTAAPLAAPAPAREKARTLSDEEVREQHDRILYAAGAGKRVPLR